MQPSTLVNEVNSSSQGHTFDLHIPHLPRGLVHPNMYSVSANSNIEYIVVHVGDSVEVQQELGIGNPAPHGSHRQTIWPNGSEPTLAVQPHRRDPFRVIKLESDCGLVPVLEVEPHRAQIERIRRQRERYAGYPSSELGRAVIASLGNRIGSTEQRLIKPLLACRILRNRGIGTDGTK